MPYKVTFTLQAAAPDYTGAVSFDVGSKPTYEMTLWPYRSLPRLGFVWFIGGTAALSAVPLLAVLGSPVLWGLMPFVLLALAAIWWALQRNYHDGEILETMAIWPDRMTLVRTGPGRARVEWSANPYWVTTALHVTGGRVPNYVTLRGGDREVELGAFLSEEERIALRIEIDEALRSLRWVDTLGTLRSDTQCKLPADTDASGQIDHKSNM